MKKPKLMVAIGVATVVVAIPLSAGSASAIGATTPPNLAGYVHSASGPTTVNSYELTPTIGTCPSLASFQAVVAGNEITTSSGRTGGGVILTCANGVASYAGFSEINGYANLYSGTVSPGNVLQVQTTESASSATVTLNDLSNGWSVSVTNSGGSPSNVSVGLIAVDCAGDTCSPVPEFRGAWFAGSFRGFAESNLNDAAGTSEATPSPLFFGLGFEVNYRFSCTPANQGLLNAC
jgi:Peptidase A4 family